MIEEVKQEPDIQEVETPESDQCNHFPDSKVKEGNQFATPARDNGQIYQI